jgi:hypothetical protein
MISPYTMATKEFWCGVKGHKLDRNYADGRRDEARSGIVTSAAGLGS